MSSSKFVDEAGTFNHYSQFGEDAVTSLAFNKLGIERGYVVEFGAGDGLHLSNTALYWRERGWEATLIEPDPERYERLLWQTAGYRTYLHNEAVTPTGKNRIDDFLRYQEVDLMSIDVDDCDYQIFQAMQVRPKLVLIEFNHTMPHHVELVGAPGSLMQASPLALVNLAKTKGYGLLSITGCNCLFIRDDLLGPFEKYNRELKDLVNPDSLTYVIADWHGRYYYHGPQIHGMLDPSGSLTNN